MENTVPFLSIIVPAYNVENYIRQCVDSICAQTFTDFELLIVDDGSKDSTGEICDTYAKIDSRIVVLHKENGGLVSARKAGINVAKGQYVACVDGDDWIAPEMMKKLCTVAKTESADIVMADLVAVRQSGNEVLSQIIEEGSYDKKSLQDKVYPVMLCAGSYFSFGLQPSVCGNVFRRELLLKNQMLVNEKISLGEDAACFYPTLLEAEKVVYLKEGYYYYRMRENSITHTVKRKLYTDAVLSLVEHLYKSFSATDMYWKVLEQQLWFYAGYMFEAMITPCVTVRELFVRKRLQKEFLVIANDFFGQKMIAYCKKNRTSSRTKRMLRAIENPGFKEKFDLYTFILYEKIFKCMKK